MGWREVFTARGAREPLSGSTQLPSLVRVRDFLSARWLFFHDTDDDTDKVRTPGGDLVSLGGGGSGGGGSQWIDCGVVDFRQVIIAGAVELYPYTAGKLISAVRYSPDNFEPPSATTTIYFITPNTTGFSGFASIPAAGQSAVDTLGITTSNNNTPFPGFGTSDQPLQILDGGPLVTVSNVPGREFFGLGTWQANHDYALGDAVLDSNDHVQEVILNGTSGGSEPTWEMGGGTTIDGTANWQDDGEITGGSVHVFAEVVDTDGEVPVPTTIEFTQQPTDADAEATVSPTVTVQVFDQNGDPYTLYQQTIVLRIFGAGTFTNVGPGSVASASTDETGLASFTDLAITEPGTYRVQATLYPSINVDAVLSDEFTISAP